ncbi:hypothetical protein CPB86DRAFT_620427 [Serendipita vermifera]|nr:hypothetical protein CPB86DRAFT_620427 [Serendipita vermifera]
MSCRRAQSDGQRRQSEWGVHLLTVGLGCGGRPTTRTPGGPGWVFSRDDSMCYNNLHFAYDCLATRRGDTVVEQYSYNEHIYIHAHILMTRIYGFMYIL